MQRRIVTASVVAYAVPVLVMAGWIASHLFPPANRDTSALIYVADRWSRGDRLYVDVFEQNTPWAIGLHIPAVVSARLFGGSAPAWFSLYVCLAVVVAIGLVSAVFARHRSIGNVTRALVPLGLLFILGIAPNQSFGQREHLLTIAAMPYLALSALRLRGIRETVWLQICVAVIAAAGFAIKPYFVIPFLAVELFLLVRRGLRNTLADPVVWTICAALVGYVLLALVATPEYFSIALPFAAATYGRLGDALARAPGMLVGPDLLPVTVLLPILTIAAFGWSRNGMARLAVLFALGGIAAALVQGKGWDYHCIPAVAGALLAGLLLVAEFVERQPVLRRRAVPAAAALTAGLLMLPVLVVAAIRLHPWADQLDYPQSQPAQWVRLLAANTGNRRALVLAGGVYPQFPAITYAGFKMAMPFLSMWPLWGLYERCVAGEGLYHPIAQQSAVEARFFKSVVDGFVAERPAVLVIYRGAGFPTCSGQRFDYLAYFMRDARFADAYRAYVPLTTLDNYEFLKRR